VVLDGEASSATEVAEAARHLPGCTDCARFAAVVIALKHFTRTASVERPEAPEVLGASEWRDFGAWPLKGSSTSATDAG